LPVNNPSGTLDATDVAAAAALALLSAVIMLPGLGAQSLANWDEAIYGVVTRELLARPGLTLHYGGHPWFEKPPLLFWLMAVSSSTFGLTEFALRLPAALFGIGAVALQYFAGRRLGGRTVGLLAAVLLLGVPQFVAYGRLAMTDVPLTALGLLSAVLIIYGTRSIGFAAAGAAFGLAILTKSAAAFLFFPGLLALIIALRGARFLWSREIFCAIAAALVVALPWHLWSLIVHGREFLDQYLVFHVLGRFQKPLEGHQGGPFYYFALYRYNAGWLALVHAGGIALALLLAFLKRDRTLAAIVVLALGAFFIVSAQGTKIGWYLTPVYPGAALAASLAVTRLLTHSVARFAAFSCALALAVPGVLHGRDRFVEQYNILDYSPEVRSLRNVLPFEATRVPLLYTMDVSDPAPRFYLADQVELVDQAQLERLLDGDRPFLCLTFKSTASNFLRAHPKTKIDIVASTQSLAVMKHE
jgi:4-amino-4-deoxy-L-arabinose transferase-like glycosyltransferase